MGHVARALMLLEFIERTRDRWVLVISLLFALLAVGVSVYGGSADAESGSLVMTGPSLVTLSSLLVPLVALVLGHDAIVGERERNTLGLLLSLPIGKLELVLAKLIGRLAALAAALGMGLGAAIAMAPTGHRTTLAQIVLPSLLLGAGFLSIGLLISSLAKRQITAASSVVAVWFLLVFFYDLGLLALLVATEGAVSSETITWLVVLNPAGLFRMQMMSAFSGPEMLESLGMNSSLPSPGIQAALGVTWVVLPAALSGLVLTRRTIR